MSHSTLTTAEACVNYFFIRSTHFHTELILALKHVAFFYVLIFFGGGGETNVVHRLVAINFVNLLKSFNRKISAVIAVQKKKITMKTWEEKNMTTANLK